MLFPTARHYFIRRSALGFLNYGSRRVEGQVYFNALHDSSKLSWNARCGAKVLRRRALLESRILTVILFFAPYMRL